MSRVEFEGQNLEEAIAKAAASLSLPPEKIKFSVSSMGTRGFLGLGRRQARISVDPDDPVLALNDENQDQSRSESAAPTETGRRDSPCCKQLTGQKAKSGAAPAKARANEAEAGDRAMAPPKPRPAERPRRSKDRHQKTENNGKEKAARRPTVPPEPHLPFDWSHVPPPLTRPAPDESRLDTSGGDKAAAMAVEVLRAITGHMGVEAEIKTSRIGQRLILFVDSPDNALLIGSRGAGLEALQLLCGKIVARRLKAEAPDSENGLRVVVDVADYRARRHQHLLETLANLAGQVRQTRRPQTMAGLNSSERRLIQLALRPYNDLALRPDHSREGLTISLPRQSHNKR